jgi:predicted lipoprotein with Yx(FWY)xxD motif
MRPTPRLLSLSGLVVGAALIAAACSSAAATPTAAVAGATTAPAAQSSTFTIGMTNDPTLGSYLTGANGMTLYVTTKDSADTSSCTGTCATTWPPLTVTSATMLAAPAGATGGVATLTRSDGTLQVTYNHMPLYYYSGDSKAGDTTGQGKGGVWSVAPLSGIRPAPAASSTAAGAVATPSPTAAASYGY